MMMVETLEIVGGWEAREATGWAVCDFSTRRASKPVRVTKLMERALRFQRLYWRPHEYRDGQLWDVISNAPMATSFANSRFLTPWLVDSGWAMSCDFSDMLFLADPAELFALADDRYAVQVVKRKYVPSESEKMDGQIQTAYMRKNWSSVILWNLDHPANTRLTQDMVNELPGRDLHRFCWLEDDDIGDLPAEWNHLVGVDPDPNVLETPKLLHYTLGIPTMAGYEDKPWSDVWKRELAILDATRGRLAA